MDSTTKFNKLLSDIIDNIDCIDNLTLNKIVFKVLRNKFKKLFSVIDIIDSLTLNAVFIDAATNIFNKLFSDIIDNIDYIDNLTLN